MKQTKWEIKESNDFNIRKSLYIYSRTINFREDLEDFLIIIDIVKYVEIKLQNFEVEDLKMTSF